MKFKIGDVVRLREDHEWARVPSNPTDKNGIVEQINYGSDTPYRVNWGMETHNFYREGDLYIPKVKDTKIARLVHKDNIEKIEGGFIWLK